MILANHGVIATGKVSTFPGSSNYQIVIEALEPAGVGALMALLEERRNRKIDNVMILRLEQLYPFANDEIAFELKKYKNAIRIEPHDIEKSKKFFKAIFACSVFCPINLKLYV